MSSFVILLLILSGTVILILSVIAFQRRTSALSFSFAACMLCAAIWNFGFAAEIISPSLEGKIFWANIQFVGIGFVSLAWLAIALIATGQSPRARQIIPALGVIPILDLLMIWTDPFHHLFRQQPFINAAGVPFPVLANDYGPFFYAVHVPYGYFLMAAALYLLVRSWRQAPAMYRRQRFMLVLSFILPLLVDVLYVMGVTPIPAFNFTPIMFSFSGVLLGINILQFRFLDILPLAYETTINEMDIGVIVLDASGQVSHLNPAAEKITGVLKDQAVGIAARQALPTLAPIWNSSTGQTEIILQQGEEVATYQFHRSAIRRDQNLAGQVITLNNITDMARLHRQVETLSITDPLTGALNRRALNQFCEQEIQSARRHQEKLSLILLDVDNFKEVNDRCGHPTGDYVLKAMVQAIRNKVRANDLIFRYGGDEFTVLLIGTGAAEALEITHRVRGDLADLPVDAEHSHLGQIRVSMGITALIPGDDLDILLRRADQALYQAKAAGKDQVVVL